MQREVIGVYGSIVVLIRELTIAVLHEADNGDTNNSHVQSF